MSLDDRLRDHLGDAAARLAEPPDRLAVVRRRGRRRRLAQRGAAVLAVVLLAAAVPIAGALLDRDGVDLEPIAPPEPTVSTPTGAPTPQPSASEPTAPDEQPTDPATEPGRTEAGPGLPAVAPSALGSAVLAYGPDHDGLHLIDGAATSELWPGPVDVALPDGGGGVLLQPAGERAVVWLPPGDAEPVRLVDLGDGDEPLLLRGVDPDGRALYSVRPPDAATGEGDVEGLFAVALADGAEPARVDSVPALEATFVGPVFPDGDAVHASCHTHCALWPGMPGSPGGDGPVYQGLTIGGLTATVDGRVLAFVEFDLALPEQSSPELVLLDAATFDELARIPLPHDEPEPVGTPVVSLSADGQRALVAFGAAERVPGPTVPTTTLLVDGALSRAPEIRHVVTDGAARWAAPQGAASLGGPVRDDERAIAESLVTFAREPTAEAFAAVPLAPEVVLGLGSDLLATPAGPELADPARWELEPEQGLFRAAVGPFSALSAIAEAGQVQVSGGPHMHCASPPMPLPEELRGLRQVSVQPAGIDSCLSWWSVDLFLDAESRIAAVTFDLWEP